MGWISDRHMRQGGSIGGRRKGRKYPKDSAPLRRIVQTLRSSGTIFRRTMCCWSVGTRAIRGVVSALDVRSARLGNNRDKHARN